MPKTAQLALFPLKKMLKCHSVGLLCRRFAVIILYYTAVELYTRTCTWLIDWLAQNFPLQA